MNQTIQYRYLFFLASTASLAGLMFGFDIAIISGAGPFIQEAFHLSDFNLGLAFSSLLFGCAVGAPATGYFAERFGRQRLLIGVAALFAITSLITGLANSFTLFLIARILGGLAVGAASILAPMYIAEIAPPRLRGRLCTFYQMAIVIGILISFLLNYLLREAPAWNWFNQQIHFLGPWNWRYMFISGIIPSLVFWWLSMKAPESPRYLYKIGSTDEAFSILEKISGKESALAQIEEIRLTLQGVKPTFRDLKNPRLKRPLTIGFVLAILIHFCGINAVIDYAPIIFKAAGFQLDVALFATFGIGIVNFVFTCFSFWTIDNFGRKPLYLLGSLGMAIILFTLGILAYYQLASGTVVLILILSYIAFFAACIGPVFWTLVPEIFPNQLRSQAMIVPVTTQWIANAVVVLFFPSFMAFLGKGPTFILFGVAAFLQFLFTWRFIPETRGKSLEEIERLWESPSGGS